MSKSLLFLFVWGLNPGNTMWQVCWPGLVRLCCNHRPAQVSEFVDNTGLVLSLEKPSQGALPCEGAEWVRLPSLIAPPGLTVLLQTTAGKRALGKSPRRGCDLEMKGATSAYSQHARAPRGLCPVVLGIVTLPCAWKENRAGCGGWWKSSLPTCDFEHIA